MTSTPAFTKLSPWLAVGVPQPPGWTSLTSQPLLILVGLTGVGKTTTVTALEAVGLSFATLPNRRLITDQLIIAWLQARDGQPASMVTDRTERFAYTRRYRELFPGGMAHALSQLWLKPEAIPSAHLLFDGLRGANEVRHAAELLPQATFIVLNAPNDVRVKRLLGRDDAFDQVETAAPQSRSMISSLAELGLETGSILTPTQENGLVQLVNRGEIESADLQAKLKIIITESNNYDPVAALSTLQSVAPERTIVTDTAQFPPEVVAHQILEQILGRKV